MDILFSEFKKKDVIDLSTGKKLGKVKDVTFFYPSGQIKSFLVNAGMFSSSNEQVFRFADIEKIGEDTILVRTRKKDDLDGCDPLCKGEKKLDCKGDKKLDKRKDGRCNKHDAPPKACDKNFRPDGFPRLDDEDYE